MNKPLFPTRVERAAYIDQRLAELYPDPAIPLDHKDAFTLLIAVLLSAHTTDRSVNKATPELFALADTPAKMMSVPVEEIQRIIGQWDYRPQSPRRFLLYRACWSKSMADKCRGRLLNSRSCREWATRPQAS